MAAVDPQLVVLAVSAGTDLTVNEGAIRKLAERVAVAVGGAGMTEAEGSVLGLTILAGDPVEVGRTLSVPAAV